VCLGSTGHIHIAKNTNAEAVKWPGTKVHEAGGVLLEANTTLISTEGATGVKLISVAEKATTTEPEALEPRAEGKVWCRLNMLLPLSQGASGVLEMPLQDAPTEGMHRCRFKAPLQPL